MKSLFITGASGFIASHVLQNLCVDRYKRICCLSRTESPTIAKLRKHEHVEFVRGTPNDVDRYAPYLASADTVVHLAAATGKATPAEHFRVNTEGTKLLVQQCEQLGVSYFLYISSIAARFHNKSKYYYAQSKVKAEEAVRNSRLRYAIVRPTIVIGRESKTWQSLHKLASAKIIPVFGDGTTKIQPIWVDDLVTFLLTIIDGDNFRDETLDLGGPEEITVECFLKRVHRVGSQAEPRVIHLPVGLIAGILSILEKPFGAFLPVTAGQLSSFRNDGTAQSNSLSAALSPRLKNIDEMLREIMDHG